MKLCRSNVEALLGAFCVAGRTFYLRRILPESRHITIEEKRPTASPKALSPTVIEWLQLRKELHDRIADPELSALLHKFIMVDLALCAEEKQATCEECLAARKDT